MTHKDFNAGDKIRIPAYYGDKIITIQSVVRDPKGAYLLIPSDNFQEGIAIAINDKVEKLDE